MSEEILIAQVTERVLKSGLGNGTAPQTVVALATLEVQDALRQHGEVYPGITP